MQKKQIALFGGSFDPPHLAHQQIPVFLLQESFVDEVWYVPVKHHPFGKVVSLDKDRLHMLHTVIQHIVVQHPEYEEKLRIESWELEQNQKSYTIQTLEELSAQYPDVHFRWVIGSDNLEQFHLWHHYQEILQNYGVFVYPREKYPAEPLREGMTLLEHAPTVVVSSTQVRAAVQASTSISSLVLPEVEQFILQHKLYT